MSLPAGHNPDASLLQGGEGVNIAPNQAGGGDSMLTGGEGVPILPSQAGGGPFDELDDAEKVELQKMAAKMTIKNRFTNEFKTDDELKQAVLETATEYANQFRKQNTEESEGSEVFEEATDEEKAAAQAAVAILPTSDEFKRKPLDKQFEDVERTALAAIMRERAKRNLKIVKVREATKATMMTTQDAPKILTLEETLVYTEFYHITDLQSTKEIDKYRTIFQIKHRELADEYTGPKMRINMFADIEKYKQQRIAQWNQTYKISDKKVNPIIPRIQETVSHGANEVLTMYSRYIYSLSHSLDTVIIIPPLNGDTDNFVKVLYRLEKIGALSYKMVAGKHRYKIKDGLTIVFMPSFYASIAGADERIRQEAINSNHIFFSIFIDMNRTSPNQVFILSENTANNYAIGTLLSKTFSKSEVFKNAPLTMLEPSYIIYPYTRSGLKDGFVISSSSGNEPSLPKINKFGLNEFKTTSYFGKSVGLAVKPDGSNVSENLDMFAIRSLEDDKSPIKITYDLNHPPGHCDGLLESPNLNEISKRERGKFDISAIVIYKDGKNLNDDNAMMVIKLNPNGDHAPLCTSALSSTAPALSMRDLHEPSDKADPNVVRVQVDIGGRMYSIREADEPVSANWKKREFTKDEADFLNATRLRPGVLQGVFGEGWPIELASFLYTFTTSKCMTDNSLLTKRECYSCREFLEKINVYIINNELQLDLQKAEFNKFADEVYNEPPPPPLIQKDHAKEANEAERQMHKLQFGNISSYTHPATRERRAFIIGLNQKTGMYKYYVVSVPSALTDIGTEEANKEEAELLKKVEKLRVTYPDNIFIY